MARRPVLIALLALLAAALFLLPALLSTVLARPSGQGPDVRFAREMIQHHAQAVDMATRIRERSQDATLRTVALDIMLSQQEQIGQMRGWMTLWGVPWAGPGMSAEHAQMMGMATPAQLGALDTLPLPQAEAHFLTLMIRHHQGALQMVAPVLTGRVRPEVLALARQIQATQSAEIRAMQRLLAERGEAGATSPPAPADHSSGHQH